MDQAQEQPLEDTPTGGPDLGGPNLDGENGWAPIEMGPLREMGPSFVSGEPEGNRLRVTYCRRESDGALVGKAWFGPGTQGPPGHGHGGSMAALLDEAMGTAAWIAGHMVLALNINVDFVNMIPLETVADVEASVEKREGRKIYLRGKLVGENGKVYAESKGLFLEVAGGQLKHFQKWSVDSKEEARELAGPGMTEEALRKIGNRMVEE